MHKPADRRRTMIGSVGILRCNVPTVLASSVAARDIRRVGQITQKWKMPAREWSAAKAQFAVMFGDRFEVNR
jgi:hypothetical protein